MATAVPRSSATALKPRRHCTGRIHAADSFDLSVPDPQGLKAAAGSLRTLAVNTPCGLLHRLLQRL